MSILGENKFVCICISYILLITVLIYFQVPSKLQQEKQKMDSQPNQSEKTLSICP